MRQIFTIWKKELRDTIRDRRTLVVSVIMPIVFMPLMMIGSFKAQEAQIKSSAEQVAVVAIENEDKAPTLSAFLKTQPKVEIKTFTGNPMEMINSGQVQTVVSPTTDFEEKIKNNGSASVTIYAKSTENKSEVAATKIMTAINLLNQKVAADRLVVAKIDPNIIQSLKVQKQDIASEKEKGGFLLGLLLPMFIVIFTVIGGMYIAIDVSAGEKERKTLEALLLTPLSRLKIVAGKFAAVASTSITSVILSVSSLYAAFKIWPPNLGEGFGNFQFSLSASTVIIMLGIGILLSIMFAGMLLAVAIFAKSYKEAQNYIMPFYLAAVLPVAILGSYPSFKPGIGFFFIPAVNAVLLFKENLMGVYSSSHIIITVTSLGFYCLIAIFVASKIYSKESVLFKG